MKVCNYAKRLCTQIEDENPTILGLSFGGIIATEIAKIISVRKIILVSSIKVRGEVPKVYRIVGKINLHHFLPYRLLKKENAISKWLFGVTGRNDKNLFQKVLADTDIDFLKWAINCIVKWDNEFIHPTMIQIHGTNDKLIPLNKNENTIKIEDGGHLMVLNKAPTISRVLQKII